MPRHGQREAKWLKSGPKEAQSGTKDGQRVALGGQNGAQGIPREAFWKQEMVENAIYDDFSENVDFSIFFDFT